MNVRYVFHVDCVYKTSFHKYSNRKMEICYFCEHKITPIDTKEDDDLNILNNSRLEVNENELKCVCKCHSIPNLILM